jgi:hypothetical protein
MIGKQKLGGENPPIHPVMKISYSWVAEFLILIQADLKMHILVNASGFSVHTSKAGGA